MSSYQVAANKIPRPKRLGSGFRIKNRQRSQIARPLPTAKSNEIQVEDLKSRVFGAAIQHSNLQSVKNQKNTHSFNLISNKAEARKKEKEEITTEDIKNFYSSLMMESNAQNQIEKKNILVDNKNFKTDFLVLKNAQSQIRDALQRIQEEQYNREICSVNSNLTHISPSSEYSKAVKDRKEYINKDEDLISPEVSNSGVHMYHTGMNSTGKSTMFHAQIESPGRTDEKEIPFNKIQQPQINDVTLKNVPNLLTPIQTESSKHSAYNKLIQQNKSPKHSEQDLKNDIILLKKQNTFDQQISSSNKNSKSCLVDKDLDFNGQQQNLKRHYTNLPRHDNLRQKQSTYSQSSKSRQNFPNADNNQTINRDLVEMDDFKLEQISQPKILTFGLRDSKQKQRPQSSKNLHQNHKNRAYQSRTKSLIRVPKSNLEMNLINSNSQSKMGDYEETNYQQVDTQKILDEVLPNQEVKKSPKTRNQRFSESFQIKTSQLLKPQSSDSTIKIDFSTFGQQKSGLLVGDPSLKAIAEKSSMIQQNDSPVHSRILSGEPTDESAQGDNRIIQMRIIENTMKKHFQHGISDVVGFTQKPILASRAFDAEHLRQIAFTKKVEQYYEQTAQKDKLNEFRLAQTFANKLFDVVSGSQSVGLSSNNNTEMRKELKVIEESSFQFMQKQHLKQSLNAQKKHQLQLQHQYLLSLSPKTNRICSSRSNQSKLVPTLVDLPDIDEIQALLNKSGKRETKQVVKQANQVKEKQDFIAASIVTSQLKLNQKPTKEILQESAKLKMHQHQKTVSNSNYNEGPVRKTRAQSANVSKRKNQTAKGGGFVNSRYYKFASQGLDQRLGSLSLKSIPLSICQDIQGKGLRIIASNESDVHLVQIGESWKGEPIMKYSAWNNQQRDMPLKMQFTVEPIKNKSFCQVFHSHPSIIHEEFNENDNPCNSGNKVDLSQQYQRFININQMQQKEDTKISQNTLQPAKLDEENQIGKVFKAENIGLEYSGVQSTSQQLVDNKYSHYSANQTLNTNQRYLKHSEAQNQSEDFVHSEIVEKEFLNDNFVPLETEITCNDLMMKAVSSNQGQRNEKTQSNLSTPQHQQISQGQRRSVLSKQRIQKSHSNKSRTSSPQVEQNQFRQSQIKTIPKIQFTVETCKAKPYTGKTKTQTRNTTTCSNDQATLHATTSNLSANQSKVKSKPVSQKNGRKTYGQRIQELVQNFDKKFILQNAYLPQAIQTDLQFKQCAIQNKKCSQKIVVDAQMIKGLSHSLKSNSTFVHSAQFNSSALVFNSEIENVPPISNQQPAKPNQIVRTDGNRIFSKQNEDIEHVCRQDDKPASPRSQISSPFRPYTSSNKPLQKQQFFPTAVDINLDQTVLNSQSFHKPNLELKESARKFQFQQKLNNKKTLASTNHVAAPRSAAVFSPIRIENPLSFLQSSNDLDIANGLKQKTKKGLIIDKAQPIDQIKPQKIGIEKKLNEMKFQHEIRGLASQDDEEFSIGLKSQISKNLEDLEDETTSINVNAIVLQNTMHTLKDQSTEYFVSDLQVNPLLKEEIANVNLRGMGTHKPEIKVKPVSQSNVRIQSGKLTAQFELMRIQHQRQFVPSDQIVQRSQARRQKAMSGNQIASVQRLIAQNSIPKLAQSQNRIELTYGDLQGFFRRLAKSSKHKTSRVQTNPASVTGRMFALQSSGIKVLRDLSARGRGFSGICRGQRPNSSQPNGPRGFIAAESVLITSKTMKGLIQKRVLNSFTTTQDQNTIQTAGRTTALSKGNESADVEKKVKIY